MDSNLVLEDGPSALLPAARTVPAPPVARSVRAGALAAGGMGAFYVAVVGGLSGSLGHLLDQVRADWYLLSPIVAGFGLQVGLVVELRRRRAFSGATVAAGTAGSGASTVGMVACCAHHLADLAPLVGAGAAAGFLVNYRVPFMLAGIGINGAGVAVAARRLRRFSGSRQEEACAGH
jgi:hypothetical protein